MLFETQPSPATKLTSSLLTKCISGRVADLKVVPTWLPGFLFLFSIPSLGLTHLKTESVHPLTTFSHFPILHPAAPGNHQSALCFCGFIFFKFRI